MLGLRTKTRRGGGASKVAVAERQPTKQRCIVFPGRPLTQVSNCESAVLLPVSTPFFPSRSLFFPSACGPFRSLSSSIFVASLFRSRRRSPQRRRAFAHTDFCFVTQFRSNRKFVAPLRFRHASRTARRTGARRSAYRILRLDLPGPSPANLPWLADFRDSPFDPYF